MDSLNVLVVAREGLSIFCGPDQKEWHLKGPFPARKKVNHATYHPGSGTVWRGR